MELHGIKLHPATAKLEDRVRKQQVRNANELMHLTVEARRILSEQLSQRFFTERPSNVCPPLPAPAPYTPHALTPLTP